MSYEQQIFSTPPTDDVQFVSAIQLPVSDSVPSNIHVALGPTVDCAKIVARNESGFCSREPSTETHSELHLRVQYQNVTDFELQIK